MLLQIFYQGFVLIEHQTHKHTNLTICYTDHNTYVLSISDRNGDCCLARQSKVIGLITSNCESHSI